MRRRALRAPAAWRALGFAAVATLALAACGRLGLVSERARHRSDAGAHLTPSPPDASAAQDGDPSKLDSGTRDASREAAPSFDASPPSVADAARDAVVDARGDADEARAFSDARTAPDCTCPPGDYYVDAIVNGVDVHFGQPFLLGLYCDETEPELAHPPCGSVYRLTACAEPGGKPPCLYASVDGRTPIIGDYVDSTGQTFELVSAEIPAPTTTNGRDAIGTFSAIYASRTSESTVTVAGTFHACATLFAPCGS